MGPLFGRVRRQGAGRDEAKQVQRRADPRGFEGAGGGDAGKATLDCVTGYGKVKGGIYFAEDPRQHDLVIRALGFRMP